MLLLLPITSSLRGLPLSQLPAYFAQGAACMAGGAPGAPLFPLLYLAANVGLNIVAIVLLRAVGALPLALTISAVVPLSVLAFSLPLPLLPPAPMGPTFALGAAIVVAGIGVYNREKWAQMLGKPKLA